MRYYFENDQDRSVLVCKTMTLATGLTQRYGTAFRLDCGGRLTGVALLLPPHVRDFPLSAVIAAAPSTPKLWRPRALSRHFGVASLSSPSSDLSLLDPGVVGYQACESAPRPRLLAARACAATVADGEHPGGGQRAQSPAGITGSASASQASLAQIGARARGRGSCCVPQRPKPRGLSRRCRHSRVRADDRLAGD